MVNNCFNKRKTPKKRKNKQKLLSLIGILALIIGNMNLQAIQAAENETGDIKQQEQIALEDEQKNSIVSDMAITAEPASVLETSADAVSDVVNISDSASILELPTYSEAVILPVEELIDNPPVENQLTMTFDANAGTGTIGTDNTQTIVGDDTTKALLPNQFTKDDFVFKDWNTVANGTGTAYADAADVTAVMNQGMKILTLYAQAEASYPVIFKLGDGKIDGTWKPDREAVFNRQTVTYGNGVIDFPILNTDFTAPADKSALESWRFSGYYRKDNGTVVPHTISVLPGNAEGYFTSAEIQRQIQLAQEYKDANPNAQVDLNTLFTFTAVWDATFTVQFNADDQNAGEYGRQVFKFEAAAQPLTPQINPTRPGYKLLGWSTTASSTTADFTIGEQVTQAANFPNVINNGTVNLYAVWEASDITVILDNGEGVKHSISTGYKYNDAYTLLSDANLRALADLSADFIPNGATLKGWTYTPLDAPDVDQTVLMLDDTIVVEVDGTLTATFTATWTHDVTFIPVGDTSTKVTVDRNTVVPDNQIPTLTTAVTGYTTNWYTTVPDGNGENGVIWDSTANVTENLTVTEATVANQYSVRYHSNYAPDQTIIDTTTFTYDKEQNLAGEIFTRTNYKLVGWATTEGDTAQKAHDLGATVTNLTTENNVTVDLYAVWEEVPPLTIIFNANGGTGTIGTDNKQIIAANAQDKTLLTDEFTRAGYEFTMWNTKPDGTGDIYLPGDPVLDVMERGQETLTLYAQWEFQYPVTFNLDRGTWQPDKETEFNSRIVTSGTNQTILFPVLNTDFTVATNSPLEGWKYTSYEKDNATGKVTAVPDTRLPADVGSFDNTMIKEQIDNAILYNTQNPDAPVDLNTLFTFTAVWNDTFKVQFNA
ncbi:MAG: InlB B-repeat-containing protein, partial [Lachnospiraceae bacterium]|nr:InlB B-repeat-containing protein [Lachnospiraceae bacterium]